MTDRSSELARSCDETCATGPGWFWTRTEWAEWSNTLASCLPEDYDDDVAQEAVIERALMDLVTIVEDVRSVIAEYDDTAAVPAPYTNDRALYERICSALGHEPITQEPTDRAE